MARARPETAVFEQPGKPRISYGKMGTGADPVVLVHGLGARWQVFSPLMRMLADDYTFYACDLRGHGESDPRPGQYRLQDFTADVARFIEYIDHGSVNVYGHSLGGWIGLSLAAGRSDLVTSLVVADSAIYPESLDPDRAMAYLAELPLVLRSMAISLDQVDPEVMVSFRSGAMLAGYHPEDLLRDIDCPTTLIQADQALGGLMTDRDVDHAHALLARSRSVRMPGLGHGLHVEDAVLVSQAVRTAFS